MAEQCGQLVHNNDPCAGVGSSEDCKSTKFPEGLKLYRGLGTTLDFPDSFFRSDCLGCRGFVEWGFVSTTADKVVAVQYSGLKDGRQLPIVLEITVGSVALGACIRELSQYPHEEEHLWVPCSFLEPAGNRVLEVTPEGVVALIAVRINVNLKARTVEEIQGQKRQLQVTAFRYLVREVQQGLWAIKDAAEARLQRDRSVSWDTDPYTGTVDDFLESIVEECERRLRAHERFGPSEYVSDEELYRSLVVEMLEVKSAAMSKLRWWLEDESRSLALYGKLPLRDFHRG